ncbi:Gfo/Idh/MocA family oxidoreductase [Bifidobacterium sp. ESL0763]|uniref:Gfo/Idh/MocA family protein n=1 Tax=Bifidobacterium sp. ESL0763 TaxID=2983227 RepID=UPI0023F6E093|nr:Gfo/Idh/MocA family oxidoreductase [Bifidobacterium sp. ESL0763]MDF7664246.1 Gfo/Idh/MocA family oxidoreductase [Bifidobacterium sp. ESL0763]
MGRLNGKRAEAQEQGLKVNVAILGAGRIACKMADTLVRMAGDPRYAELVAPYAVAARDAGRAADFAHRYGFEVSYGSYDELLADPKVDLVYIATPHALHAEQGIACLRAGKNILVEKSFTANTAQAERLLDVAHETGLLCAEAIWTRYMPSRALVADLIKSGAIGEVQAATANLCYPTTNKPRMIDPAMAGGALLDVGVYPLNFFDMALGADTSERSISSIETSMVPYETGVDATDSIALHYDDGVMATATSSMMCASDRSGAIWGTKGYMVCQNVNDIEGIDLYDIDHHLTRHVDVPEQLTGYEYEVASTANAILDGKGECEEMPHADTLRIMRLMDRIRGIWGLKYPFE